MKRIIAFLAVVVMLISGMYLTKDQIYQTDSSNKVTTPTLGLDLQGGFEVLYEITPLEGQTIPSMDAVVSSLRKRIDILGVNEPIIVVEGDNRIRVQLAGVTDETKAREILSAGGVLSFRDSDDNLIMDSTVLKEGGAALAFDQGSPVVTLKIKDTKEFYAGTQKIAARPDQLMVTWLDYKKGDKYQDQVKLDPTKQNYISAATVREGLNSSEVVISGSFSEAEARELADLINSGSLQFEMKEIYANSVSAAYGEQAFHDMIKAGFIGSLLVFAFVLLSYGFAGAIASVTLLVYAYSVLFIFNSLSGTLTLPGIAALVLGVGMAVDANIISFERIKDELYKGGSMMHAVKTGGKHALGAIIDANLTTFVAAVVLFAFGTSSVKGFAMMFMITIFVTMVVCVYLTRLLVGLFVSSGFFDNNNLMFMTKKKYFEHQKDGKPAKKPFERVDFIKQSKYFQYFSIAVITIGLVCTLVFGLNLGIDFKSGSTVTFEATSQLNKDSITSEIKKIDPSIEVVDVSVKGNNNELVYVRTSANFTQSQDLKIKETLAKDYNVKPNISSVDPIVGIQLVKNALISLVIVFAVLIVYISARYKKEYAIAAVIALMHDCLIVFAIFAIFKIEISSVFIAAMLAIVGYSLNDTIITFDRIREIHNKTDFKHAPTSQDYKDIANLAIRQTFKRSLNTSLTTILAVIALLLFTDSINEFLIAMFFGLIAGTYSSIYIASNIWVKLVSRNQKPKKERRKLIKINLDEPDEHVFEGINN